MGFNRRARSLRQHWMSRQRSRLHREKLSSCDPNRSGCAVRVSISIKAILRISGENYKTIKWHLARWTEVTGLKMPQEWNKPWKSSCCNQPLATEAVDQINIILGKALKIARKYSWSRRYGRQAWAMEVRPNHPTTRLVRASICASKWAEGSPAKAIPLAVLHLARERKIKRTSWSRKSFATMRAY